MLRPSAGIKPGADPRLPSERRMTTGAKPAIRLREEPMLRCAAAAFAAFLTLCGGASADTRVTYFPVPAGAHPHDVAAAPDGAVWYTAQSQGALCILDPK